MCLAGYSVNASLTITAIAAEDNKFLRECRVNLAGVLSIPILDIFPWILFFKDCKFYLFLRGKSAEHIITKEADQQL